MEVFNTFDGGQVTQEHPTKLADNESVLVENADIVAGGVLINRGAYVKTNDPKVTITGISQGVFNYENLFGGVVIEAIGGKLYTVLQNTYTLLTITGLASFQTTRLIEAVQHGSIMYIATGSGLVKFDGTTASLVTPYTPTGDEALYTGLNALAADPESYIQDTTASDSNTILGFKCASRYGLTNTYTDITAYVDKISTDTLEYRWSSKYSTEAKYTVWQDWSTNKVYHHKYAKKTDYSIKCEIRKQGTTNVLDDYILSKFRVLSSPDPKPAPTINGADLSLCNRILVHYDRLMIYGDTGNPNNLYISQLNNFAYFPRTNTIVVHDPFRGILQSVIQYRNFLLTFTDNIIYMITGSSPADYDKQPINTTVGTTHPYSVQATQNYVLFVAKDNRLYMAKLIRATSLMMDVQPMDIKVKDDFIKHVRLAVNVLSTVYNEQYYLYVGSGVGDNYLYRYYYNTGVWVRDKVAVDFNYLTTIYNTLTASSNTNGRIYKLSKGVYFDDVNTQFAINIISKDYDYGMPYHKKKLKQFQLLCTLNSVTTVNVNLYLDDVIVAENVSGDPSQNNKDSQKLIISMSGRFRYIKTNLQITVMEDIQILGFGFIFKYGMPK